MFLKRTDNLTSDLTSYDFLKFISVLFMFIDHAGAYFFPDEIWFRVFGRLGFPAFFFLAGFSKSHQITNSLWWGGALLIGVSGIFGQYLFPMNALVTFLCIRIFLTPFYKVIFSGYESLIYAFAALLFLTLPTFMVFEYGTLAFILAMFGYAVRNRENLPLSKETIFILFLLTTCATGFLQALDFSFNKVQTIVCIAEIFILCSVLYFFQAKEFPTLTRKIPVPLTHIIQFFGRYSLEIYVVHLVIIKIIMFYMHYGHYEWFSPTLTPHPVINIPDAP